MTVQDYTDYNYVPDELQNVQTVQQTNPLEKIATSREINKAADDPALLAISEQLNLNQSGLTQSIENVNNAISALNIGEDALSNQAGILDTVRERLQTAATDTTNDEQRAIINDEVNRLLEQFDNIASSTNYNGETLLQKDFENTDESNGLSVQTSNDAEDTTSLEGIQSNTEGLNLSSLADNDSLTAQNASEYLDLIDNAIEKLSDYRSEVGSVSNQLESSFNSLSSQYANNGAASSVISNIDYASEVADFSKQNILAQVGSFGQAQANNINQHSVLKVLL